MWGDICGIRMMETWWNAGRNLSVNSVRWRAVEDFETFPQTMRAKTRVGRLPDNYWNPSGLWFDTLTASKAVDSFKIKTGKSVAVKKCLLPKWWWKSYDESFESKLKVERRETSCLEGRMWGTNFEKISLQKLRLRALSFRKKKNENCGEGSQRGRGLKRDLWESEMAQR